MDIRKIKQIVKMKVKKQMKYPQKAEWLVKQAYCGEFGNLENPDISVDSFEEGWDTALKLIIREAAAVGLEYGSTVKLTFSMNEETGEILLCYDNNCFKCIICQK